MNSLSNNNDQQEDKNHLGYNDNDVANKIEQIKANRVAKGKPVSTDNNDSNEITPVHKIESVLGDETKNRLASKQLAGSSIESTQALVSVTEEKDSPQEQKQQSTFTNTSINNPAEKKYKDYQSDIQSTFAMMQGARISEIAKLAKKDKHIIYQFVDSKTPPTLGKKPNKKERLVPIEVFYNEIENFRHVEWDKARAEIQHLQRIKGEMSPTVSEDGITQPAKRTVNNEQETGITDEVFSNIDVKIYNKQSKLYQEIALWMFGIDEELYKHVETTSFTAALEAGQYREQFGLVEPSKNSTDYLT